MLNLKTNNIVKIMILSIGITLVGTGLFMILKSYKNQDKSYTIKLIEMIDKDEESQLSKKN